MFSISPGNKAADGFDYDAFTQEVAYQTPRYQAGPRPVLSAEDGEVQLAPGGITPPFTRRNSLDHTPILMRRPSTSTCLWEINTKQQAKTVFCPVLFIAFEGNTNFMRKMIHYKSADTRISDSAKTRLPQPGEEFFHVAPDSYIKSYTGDDDDIEIMTTKSSTESSEYTVFGTSKVLSDVMNDHPDFNEDFYSEILSDRLSRLGILSTDTTRDGLPRVIFLSEQPLQHPERLYWKTHEWERLGSNSPSKPTLQRISVYIKQGDDIKIANDPYIIGSREALVILVKDDLMIAATHMDSSLTRVNTNLARAMAVKSDQGLDPDVVLGDLNMCSIGMIGGVFPTTEDDAARESYVERSSSNGKNHYMGGYINTWPSVRTIPTRGTWGARSLPPLTTFGSDLEKKMGLTPGTNNVYVFSDHHSIYANYYKSDGWGDNSLHGATASDAPIPSQTQHKMVVDDGDGDETEMTDNTN